MLVIIPPGDIISYKLNQKNNSYKLTNRNNTTIAID